MSESRQPDSTPADAPPSLLDGPGPTARPASFCPHCNAGLPLGATICMHCKRMLISREAQRLEYSTLPERPQSASPMTEMQIDTGFARRMLGHVGYLLFFALVCGTLIFLFLQITPSVKLAVGLVGFMVGYMLLMAHLMKRKWRKDDFNQMP